MEVEAKKKKKKKLLPTRNASNNQAPTKTSDPSASGDSIARTESSSLLKVCHLQQDIFKFFFPKGFFHFHLGLTFMSLGSLWISLLPEIYVSLPPHRKMCFINTIIIIICGESMSFIYVDD